MHHSGPLPLTFEDLEQGFGGKNCQNGSQGKLYCKHSYKQSCKVKFFINDLQGHPGGWGSIL